jgi:hypothetical protein
MNRISREEHGKLKVEVLVLYNSDNPNTFMTVRSSTKKEVIFKFVRIL